MDVCLINPRSVYLENDAAYPPMWAMYIAAKIEEFGHTARILDLTCNTGVSACDVVADVIMTTSVTPNYPAVSAMIDTISPTIPVILGGPHVTHMPANKLPLPRNGNNISIVRGEAETIIADILKHDRSVYDGGMADIKDIIKPARNLVDLAAYTPGGDNTTPVYSSRGCGFSCAFCSKITGSTCRLFPLEQFSSELDDISTQGFQKFVLGDDNASVNMHRLPKLLKIIKDHNMTFRINQDSRGIKPKYIDQLVAAGCTDISFGIESGSQKILNAMNKQATVSGNIDAVRIAKSAGLNVRIYLVSNFPGESISTINETIKFVETTKPDSILVSNFAPLPGSDTFNKPWKYGITWISNKWGDFYLVGKGGNISTRCFATRHLTPDKQAYLHDRLVSGIGL